MTDVDTIHATGKTLDEACARLSERVPEGLVIWRRKTLDDGRPRVIRQCAKTESEAFQKAERKAGAGCAVLSRNVVRAASQEQLEVEAFGSGEARITCARCGRSLAKSEAVSLPTGSICGECDSALDRELMRDMNLVIR